MTWSHTTLHHTDELPHIPPLYWHFTSCLHGVHFYSPTLSV